MPRRVKRRAGSATSPAECRARRAEITSYVGKEIISRVIDMKSRDDELEKVM